MFIDSILLRRNQTNQTWICPLRYIPFFLSFTLRGYCVSCVMIIPTKKKDSKLIELLFTSSLSLVLYLCDKKENIKNLEIGKSLFTFITDQQTFLDSADFKMCENIYLAYTYHTHIFKWVEVNEKTEEKTLYKNRKCMNIKRFLFSLRNFISFPFSTFFSLQFIFVWHE